MAVTVALTTANATPPSSRPNFLLIVADDLGFSDLGAFGGEIRTPALDRLAQQGVRLTQFHAQSVCAPTRAELLSGTDTHIAGIGWMGGGPLETRGQPGYEDYLNFRVAAVSELLQQSGYYTVMAGKWHLGRTPEQTPWGRGFERSFALLGGGQLHFKVPPELAGKPLTGTPYSEDGAIAQVPDDFYSTTFYTDKLLDYLKQQETNNDTRPFFAYLTYTAPHWPLHVLPEDKDLYAGRYDGGPAPLRRQRLLRQIELGLIDRRDAAEAHPFQYGIAWADLTEEERRISARKMELYAAMVDNLDRNVARVAEYLEKTGKLTNTVIVFLSDNGAEGNQVIGPAGWDNSLENLGNVDSFPNLGVGWAQTASAPSRLHKAYTSEGGTRVPAFITYSKLARQGVVGNAFATVQDITPTILELAKVDHPTTFKGRPIEPLRGKSLVRYLQKRSERVHSANEAHGWEQFGQRAIRLDRWKAVYQREPDGREPRWQLFDLKRDAGERIDLGLWLPRRLADMQHRWEEYAEATGVIVLPPFQPFPVELY